VASPPVNQVLDEIRQTVEFGRHGEALTTIERLLRFQPDPNDWFRTPHLTSSDMTAIRGLCEAILKEVSTQKQATEQSRAHGILGYIALRLGSVHDAERHLRAAIHILSWDLGDIAGSTRQQRRLAVVFKNLGRYHQARFECERAIELADLHGLERESQANRQNLAIVLVKMGKLDEASKVFDELSTRIEAPSDARIGLRLTLARANYFRMIGQLGKALELLTSALETIREQQLSREEAIALEYMGDCYFARKEIRKAHQYFERALAIADDIAPDGDVVPELCQRIGEVMIHLGDANAAMVSCERGLRVARNASDRYEECATHRVYAMAHEAAGNPRKALRIADEGIELARRYEIPYELARALAWAGEMRSRSVDLEEQSLGRRQLWEARGVFEQMGLTQSAGSLDCLLGLEPMRDTANDQALADDISGLDRSALRVGIVTSNEKVSEAVQILQSVASSQIPVLITGESGVGKELLAQALHQMSTRRKGPFVPVNCGAISVNLLDSEFFGHERGAFTGAVTSREGLLVSADKGTLFLDEVGDLPLQVQAALLRVLETGEVRAVGRDDVRRVDIRIVAATNAGLENLVSRSQFRQDLFYRLNGIRITVPPLREREEDIRTLFRFFWSQISATAKKRLKIDDTVESLLCAYHWPGNVRELRHEVARVVALAPDGSSIGSDAFLPQLKRRDVGSLRREHERREETSGERLQIVMALRAHRGNKAEAARSLGGMKRTTLIYKIERLGIRPDEYQVKD